MRREWKNIQKVFINKQEFKIKKYRFKSQNQSFLV